MTVRGRQRISSAAYSNAQAMDVVVRQCTTAFTNALATLTNKDASEPTKDLIAASAALFGSFFEAKLSAQALVNQKTLAEAHEHFELARKANAETRAIELQNMDKTIDLVKKMLSMAPKIGKLARGNRILLEGEECDEKGHDEDRKENPQTGGH